MAIRVCVQCAIAIPSLVLLSKGDRGGFDIHRIDLERGGVKNASYICH